MLALPVDMSCAPVYRGGLSSNKQIQFSIANAAVGLVIERADDVLTFTLDDAEHGNEVTGPMFDAMPAELRTGEISCLCL